MIKNKRNTVMAPALASSVIEELPTRIDTGGGDYLHGEDERNISPKNIYAIPSNSSI